MTDGLFQTLALSTVKSAVTLSAPELQESRFDRNDLEWSDDIEIFSMIAEHQALSSQKDNAVQSQNSESSIASAKLKQSGADGYECSDCSSITCGCIDSPQEDS